MRPAVLTVILLLVCIQDTETAMDPTQHICNIYRDSPCGDGWSRIDKSRCAKFIGSPKTFHEAQEHCSTLDSDLVSVHSPNEMIQVLCLTWRADSDQPNIWTGATRSEGGFRYTDGSKFKYAVWFLGEANSDGQKGCIQLQANALGYYNNAHCSEKKNFVCAKKM